MIEKIDRDLKKNKGLLTGSGIFLVIVIYLNLRYNRETGIVDFFFIAIGLAVFIYALFQRIRLKKTRKVSKV